MEWLLLLVVLVAVTAYVIWPGTSTPPAPPDDTSEDASAR
jgi:hypothetical protein